VLLTSAYYPQGDGISERALQSVQTKIRILFEKTKNIKKCATVAVRATKSIYHQVVGVALYTIIEGFTKGEIDYLNIKTKILENLQRYNDNRKDNLFNVIWIKKFYQ
jgi:hypothetical protein